MQTICFIKDIHQLNKYLHVFPGTIYFSIAHNKSRELTQQILLESASPECFLSPWKFPLPRCPGISIPTMMAGTTTT